MIKIYEFENNYHFDLNINDEDMKIYDKLSEILKTKSKLIKHFNTFETPVFVYEHEGTEFSLLFDEMIDEPFVSVEKKSNYLAIKDLISECLINV